MYFSNLKTIYVWNQLRNIKFFFFVLFLFVCVLSKFVWRSDSVLSLIKSGNDQINLCQNHFNLAISHIILFFFNNTSVDTEMCCPKGKCGCHYFILLTLKKKSWTQGSWNFFTKKLILDYYFCLKSGPVFLFQIFIIALLTLPLPLPRDIKLYH